MNTTPKAPKDSTRYKFSYDARGKVVVAPTPRTDVQIDESGRQFLAWKESVQA